MYRPCRLAAAGLPILLLTSTSVLAAGEPFPPELVGWAADDANPLFQGAGAGHWDVKIRERGWILRDGATWKMWYTGYDGTRAGVKHLGYATSPDGLKWTRHPENPIYDGHWVEDMTVVKQNKTYYMFAEGKGDQAQLLTSQDGIRWMRQGPVDVRLANGEPIEKGPYGTPTAWHEDGTWYLFYERRDAGVWLATSQDMQVWKNVSDEPVLSPGQGSHDQDLIAMNQIIKHKGRYYACYHGTSREPKPNLWTSNLAVSTDLIHWKKYPGNPLLPARENKSSNLLIHDGRRFRLYTMHDQVHVHFPRGDAQSQAQPKSGSSPTLAEVAAGRVKIVDLTYALNEKNAYWPGDDYQPFELKTIATLEKDGVLSKAFSMPEHLGTHIDAPNHFETNQPAVDRIEAKDLFAPGVVIDVAGRAEQNQDYALSVDDIHSWEKQHGRIPDRAVVLLRTGWGRFWTNYDRYKNQDVRGRLHFPAFSPEAAEFLVKQRGCRGVGIDTLSIDVGISKDFGVHHIVNKAGRYALENVANLDKLPPRGFHLVIAPIKIESGSGGPTRIFAVLPKGK